MWLAVLTEVLFDGTRLRSGPAYHTVDKIVSGPGIGIVGANRPRNNSMGEVSVVVLWGLLACAWRLYDACRAANRWAEGSWDSA